MGEALDAGVIVLIIIAMFCVGVFIAAILDKKEEEEKKREAEEKKAKKVAPTPAEPKEQSAEELRAELKHEILEEIKNEKKNKRRPRLLWAAVLFILQIIAAAGQSYEQTEDLGYSLLGAILLYIPGIIATILVFLSKPFDRHGYMFSKLAIAIFLMGMQIALVIGMVVGLAYLIGVNVIGEFARTIGSLAPSIVGIILLIIEEWKLKGDARSSS